MIAIINYSDFKTLFIDILQTFIFYHVLLKIKCLFFSKSIYNLSIIYKSIDYNL